MTNIYNYRELKREKQQNADSPAARGVVASGHILTTGYPDFDTDILFNSFYIPVDVLRNPAYRIEPIKIISGKEFAEFSLSEEIYKWNIKYEASTHDMLINCKQIGVSARKILATGEKILVLKPWYGKVEGVTK